MKSSTESPKVTLTTSVTKCKEQQPNLKTTMLPLDSVAASVTCLEHSNIRNWQVEDVLNWAETIVQCSKPLLECLRNEAIDGQVLLVLIEEDIRDMRYKLNYQLTFGEMKKFWLAVQKLQPKTKELPPTTLLGLSGHLTQAASAAAAVLMPPLASPCACPPECPSYISDCEAYFNARKKRIPPEYFKTAISLCYSFLVTWITSFVMVIVHERVPDMKRYPPLPDIFLDNVPHIPWAFNMCEVTGTLLFSIWIIVIIFHKYRTVVLRRFFALAGTVFLLRCVTMLITSLSVPGTHLQCNQKDFAIDDADLDLIGCLWVRMRRAYTIWSGLGMSIQGVRTCGDYMFSGHTVALTLLNFFITEYTPRNLYFLHTLTWLLNMFGIFFILAAHEHYSIDVFVAFYITSRLFLYYHTLANNQALMQSDSTRTRIWFPMFSYFESNVEGIIPNDYDNFTAIIDNLLSPIVHLKDFIMLTAHRIWLDPPILRKSSEHLLNGNSAPSSEAELCQHKATSPYYSIHSNNASQIDLLAQRQQRKPMETSQQQQQQQTSKRQQQQEQLESENEVAARRQRFSPSFPVNRPKTMSMSMTSLESNNEALNTKKRL